VSALCLAKEDAEQAGRFGGLEPATVTRPRPRCRSVSGPATHARAGRYRQTDRCPWLADTSPAFMGSHLLKADEVSTVKCVSVRYSATFRSPYSRLCDYTVCLDLNGQENAFSLQCSRFSRKLFLNNLILAEHLTIPSLRHGRCSD